MTLFGYWIILEKKKMSRKMVLLCRLVDYIFADGLLGDLYSVLIYFLSLDIGCLLVPNL